MVPYEKIKEDPARSAVSLNQTGKSGLAEYCQRGGSFVVYYTVKKVLILFQIAEIFDVLMTGDTAGFL